MLAAALTLRPLIGKWRSQPEPQMGLGQRSWWKCQAKAPWAHRASSRKHAAARMVAASVDRGEWGGCKVGACGDQVEDLWPMQRSAEYGVRRLKSP